MIDDDEVKAFFDKATIFSEQSEDYHDLPLIAEPRFKLITPVELITRPHPGWHIKHVIPNAEMVVIYGPPGCGKTFSTTDMVLSISRGIDWCGHKVKDQRKVVYICAESASNFAGRLMAYCFRHNINIADLTNFHIITDVPNLLSIYDIPDLAQQIDKASIIVIDTLSRVMPTADENKTPDMNKIVKACQDLHKFTGATILLVHHTGKNTDNGARGSNVLLGATDCEIAVEKIQGNMHKLTVTKQRDGESGEVFGFTLPQMKIGTDEDGEDITSCTFEPCTVEKKEKSDVPSEGPMEKIVMEAYRSFESPYVSNDELITEVALKIPHDPQKQDQRRKRVRQAIENIVMKNRLSLTKEGLLYIP